MRHLIPARAAAYLAVAALATAGTATAALAQDDDPPVSAVQLCAATDIDQVDALLARVAATELVQDLAPLASLTVPRDPDGVTVAADVDLDQVRQALRCDDTAPTPEPTPTPTPTGEPPATTAPDNRDTTAPTTSVPVDDSPSFTQLDEVPSAAAETGGGPA